MSSRQLRITYTGDARGVLGALKTIEDANVSVGDKLRQVGQRMTSAGKTLTKGLTLPIVAFGAASVKAFGEAQKVTAQTEAALKSTGGAAGVTGGEIAKLATRIQNYSGLSDEAVQSGENLLLTFTQIQNKAGKGNDIFNQATKTIADLSVAMGQDMKTSAIQVGKALNDPIAGLTSLSKIGVRFTEAQKKQIAAMVEAGDVMGAQKLILSELTTEFGGSAKAVGETAAGKWQIAKERIGNAMESIGKVIVEIGLPIFEKLSSALQTALRWFNDLPDGTKKTIIAIAAAAAAIGPLLIILGKLVSAIGVVAKAFTAVSALLSANPYVLLIAATVALVILIVKNWDTIKEFLLKAWEFIVDKAKFFWDNLAIFIIGPMKLAIDFLVDHWRGFKEKFLGLWHTISDVVTVVVGGIVATIQGIVDIIQDIIDGVKTALGWLAKLNPFAGTAPAAGTVGRGAPGGGQRLQHGGIVTRPTIALLGEAGPEAVVPLGRGMGGVTINVNVGTLVGSSAQELAVVIRDELVRMQRRNLVTGIV